jgi:uncharacterized protein
MNLTLTWEGIEYRTLEKCLVKARAEGYEVISEINGTIDNKPVELRYRILLDDTWTVKEFYAENILPSDSFKIHYLQRTPGRWIDENGRSLPQFNDCIDIDIFPTPFTNSLPLKRTPLRIGEYAEFKMLWVDLVEGVSRCDLQRYKRLDNHVYRFTSLDTGFTADINFTEDLFVQHYPGLFINRF